MRKIEMGKKYLYRNGKPARILCCDRNKDEFTVISLDVTNGNIYSHTESGLAFSQESAMKDGLDLIEVVEPIFVPLEAMDILPSYRFTSRNCSMNNFWWSAIAANNEWIRIGDDHEYTWDHLRSYFYVDRLDGKGWVACEKELHQEVA